MADQNKQSTGFTRNEEYGKKRELNAGSLLGSLISVAPYGLKGLALGGGLGAAAAGAYYLYKSRKGQAESADTVLDAATTLQKTISPLKNVLTLQTTILKKLTETSKYIAGSFTKVIMLSAKAITKPVAAAVRKGVETIRESQYAQEFEEQFAELKQASKHQFLAALFRTNPLLAYFGIGMLSKGIGVAGAFKNKLKNLIARIRGRTVQDYGEAIGDIAGLDFGDVSMPRGSPGGVSGGGTNLMSAASAAKGGSGFGGPGATTIMGMTADEFFERWMLTQEKMKSQERKLISKLAMTAIPAFGITYAASLPKVGLDTAPESAIFKVLSLLYMATRWIGEETLKQLYQLGQVMMTGFNLSGRLQRPKYLMSLRELVVRGLIGGALKTALSGGLLGLLGLSPRREQFIRRREEVLPEEERRVRQFASGGVIYGPNGEPLVTLVGERGPELLELPQGSRIINAERTKKWLEEKVGLSLQEKVYSEAWWKQEEERIKTVGSDKILYSTLSAAVETLKELFELKKAADESKKQKRLVTDVIGRMAPTDLAYSFTHKVLKNMGVSDKYARAVASTIRLLAWFDPLIAGTSLVAKGISSFKEMEANWRGIELPIEELQKEKKTWRERIGEAVGGLGASLREKLYFRPDEQARKALKIEMTEKLAKAKKSVFENLSQFMEDLKTGRLAKKGGLAAAIFGKDFVDQLRERPKFFGSLMFIVPLLVALLGGGVGAGFQTLAAGLGPALLFSLAGLLVGGFPGAVLAGGAGFLLKSTGLFDRFFHFIKPESLGGGITGAIIGAILGIPFGPMGMFAFALLGAKFYSAIVDGTLGEGPLGMLAPILKKMSPFGILTSLSLPKLLMGGLGAIIGITALGPWGLVPGIYLGMSASNILEGIQDVLRGKAKSRAERTIRGKEMTGEMLAGAVIGATLGLLGGPFGMTTGAMLGVVIGPIVGEIATAAGEKLSSLLGIGEVSAKITTWTLAGALLGGLAGSIIPGVGTLLGAGVGAAAGGLLSVLIGVFTGRTTVWEAITGITEFSTWGLAGAVIGGILGSMIPGIGTAIGAGVGFLAGGLIEIIVSTLSKGVGSIAGYLTGSETAGSAIGNITKYTVLGTIIGAGIGSIFPGIGTAIGAGIGAAAFGLIAAIIEIINNPPSLGDISRAVFNVGATTVKTTIEIVWSLLKAIFSVMGWAGEKIIGAVSWIWEKITGKTQKEADTSFFDLLKQRFSGMSVSEVTTSVIHSILSPILGDKVAGAISWTMGKLVGVGTYPMRAIWSGVKGAGGAAANWLMNITGFAKGGVVPGPVDKPKPIIVGEKGPEILMAPAGSRILSHAESKEYIKHLIDIAKSANLRGGEEGDTPPSGLSEALEDFSGKMKDTLDKVSTSLSSAVSGDSSVIQDFKETASTQSNIVLTMLKQGLQMLKQVFQSIWGSDLPIFDKLLELLSTPGTLFTASKLVYERESTKREQERILDELKAIESSPLRMPKYGLSSSLIGYLFKYQMKGNLIPNPERIKDIKEHIGGLVDVLLGDEVTSQWYKDTIASAFTKKRGLEELPEMLFKPETVKDIISLYLGSFSPEDFNNLLFYHFRDTLDVDTLNTLLKHFVPSVSPILPTLPQIISSLSEEYSQTPEMQALSALLLYSQPSTYLKQLEEKGKIEFTDDYYTLLEKTLGPLSAYYTEYKKGKKEDWEELIKSFPDLLTENIQKYPQDLIREIKPGGALEKLPFLMEPILEAIRSEGSVLPGSTDFRRTFTGGLLDWVTNPDFVDSTETKEQIYSIILEALSEQIRRRADEYGGLLPLDSAEVRNLVNQLDKRTEKTTAQPYTSKQLELAGQAIAKFKDEFSQVQIMWPPVPGTLRVPQGLFRAPRIGGRLHQGIDILTPLGTPISTPLPGRVTVAKDVGGAAGMMVRIIHGTKPPYIVTEYMHLSKLSVREGDIVSTGDIIGRTGETGNAVGTPPHLHFGMMVIPDESALARKNEYMIDPFMIFPTLGEGMAPTMLSPESLIPKSFSERVRSGLDIIKGDITENYGRIKFLISKKDYTELWNQAQIRPNWRPRVAQVGETILRYSPRYIQVSAGTGVPWWVIGAIHNLESNFDFSRHLHNGDPLTAPTVHVPAGRPKNWRPGMRWEESAKDALSDKAKPIRWDLNSTLTFLEAYNGFGYRDKGVPSPYLWSGTNIYERGKFVADGVYNPNAISQQVGAAAVMKYLAEKNVLPPDLGLPEMQPGAEQKGGAEVGFFPFELQMFKQLSPKAEIRDLPTKVNLEKVIDYKMTDLELNAKLAAQAGRENFKVLDSSIKKSAEAIDKGMRSFTQGLNKVITMQINTTNLTSANVANANTTSNSIGGMGGVDSFAQDKELVDILIHGYSR